MALETESELSRILTRLESSLAEFAEAIKSESHPAWVAAELRDADARAKAAEIITQIDYEDGQIGNEAVILPGLIGVNAELLALAQIINGHKEALRKALLDLKGQTIELVSPTGRSRQVQADLHILARLGHARLHRLQAWRQIPVLDARPAAVWFAWSESKKVYRINCAEARRRLIALGADQPHIAWQLKRLSALKPDTPLGVIGRARPHARANIFWPDKQMMQMRASLPLFYPANPGEPLPELSPIAEDRQKRTKRSQRSDTHLQAEPFLPSIHAYAYLHEPLPR